MLLKSRAPGIQRLYSRQVKSVPMYSTLLSTPVVCSSLSLYQSVSAIHVQSSFKPFPLPIVPIALLLRSFSTYPDHIVLTMPALSPTMEKGNIASWLKKEGQAINAGEAMAEVETDKATVTFDAVEEGFLAKILIPAGSTDVVVGTPVAVLAENDGDVAAFADYNGSGPTSVKSAAPAPLPVPVPVSLPVAAPKPVAVAAPKPVADAPAPVAAKPTSAPPAKIVAPLPPPPVVPAGVMTHQELAQLLEKQLAFCKATVPHYYVNVECQVDALQKLLDQINTPILKDGTRPQIGVRDVAVKAFALAMAEMPAINSYWMPAAMRQLNSVSVCINVPTPSGLVSVCIKDANTKGLAGISSEVASLTRKLCTEGLPADKVTGGCLTITAMGDTAMGDFGGPKFTAIVANQQSSSISLGHIYTKVTSLPTEGKASSVSKYILVSASFDHRVIDGAVGAQFLKVVKDYIESPLKLLL